MGCACTTSTTRGRRRHGPVLPRRAELELPLPAYARRPDGRRAPGRLPRPRRVRPLGQADRPGLVHVRPPRRDRQRAPRPARPRRTSPSSCRTGAARIGLRWAVEHADRVAPPGRAEHRPVHRPREQGLHGLARVRRAHARPADRDDHPGRHDDRPRRPRSWPPTRPPFPTPESKAGAQTFPLLVPLTMEDAGVGRDGRRPRGARRLGQACPRGVLRQRPRFPFPRAGERFTAADPDGRRAGRASKARRTSSRRTAARRSSRRCGHGSRAATSSSSWRSRAWPAPPPTRS